MIHSQLELAPLPVHFAVDHQAAFAVAQRLDVLPLKLGQLDPFSRLTTSLEQLQPVSVDGHPHVAFSLLLPTLAAFATVIDVIIVRHVVIVVAGFLTTLGLLSAINVVRRGASG